MMWQLRAPNEGDVSFIFNSWLKSYRQAAVNIDISNAVYFKHMHASIEAVIRSENTNLVVACSPANGDENVIFGYGVAERLGDELCIHWVYCKHPFRSFGMARAIEAELLKLPHTSVSYSCQSKLSKTLNRARNYTFNPWNLWSKTT